MNHPAGQARLNRETVDAAIKAAPFPVVALEVLYPGRKDRQVYTQIDQVRFPVRACTLRMTGGKWVSIGGGKQEQATGRRVR